VLTGSIFLFLAAVVLLIGLLLLPSLAMAQQLQQQQQTTAPSVTTSQTTTSLTSPLTPQEQEQQARLQNVIAATTRDLNETEKQVSGIVYTPRWSEPVWVNPNSIAVLVAYCLPGEFADSGQEILGGFGLEVLESYAVDLPQGFMAWMAVVGNEDDIQNGRRLPAAVGVICASDLNNTDTRVLSPQEQQQINNVISQFTTIQNTQITNIDQVIKIINNVTTPQNGTGGVTEPSFTAEIIPNATEGFITYWIELKSKVTGGTEPYAYLWEFIPPAPMGLYSTGCPSDPPFNMTIGAVDDCRLVTTYRPGTHGVSLTVTDSKNQTASDTVQITLKELLPLTVEAIANATQGFPGDTIRFDANTVGGPPDPYCTWDWTGAGEMLRAKSFNHQFLAPGTYNFTVTVSCSFPTSSTASDTVQITIKERPQGGGLLGEGVLDNATLAGEGFRAGIIANATQVYTGSTIKFDASIRGGAPPYSYSWSSDLGLIDQDRSITLNFFEPGTFTYILTATDSNGQTASDSIQITVEERPGGVLPPPETGQEGEPLGGGLLPSTPPPPPPNDNEVISPPEGGGEEPPTTEEEGGEEPSAPPPPDDTGAGEGEGGEEPSTDEEETTNPPDGG
jgi:hypothetical protein